MQEYEDITTKGTKGLKGLKGISETKKLVSLEELEKMKMAPNNKIQALLSTDGEFSSGMNIGFSRYDRGVYDPAQLERAQDIRAENQSGLEKITNGIAKGAVLAGTTFADGVIGLPIGLAKAIGEGKFSGLWDNEFSQAMQSINDMSERLLPNYYTREEQENPWGHVFSANFIGDKFLKNIGFTVGAFYSGKVSAGAIEKISSKIGENMLDTAMIKMAKASTNEMKQAATAGVQRALNTPAFISSAIGSTISAVNEGRIEAINNSREWYNYQKNIVDDMHQSNLSDIATLGNTPEAKRLLEREEEDYNAALERLNTDRAKMGNMDLLMNIPILTASNWLQFGKLYGGGFKTARMNTNIVNKGRFKGVPLEQAWATAKKEGMSWSDFAKEFAQYAPKEVSKLGRLAPVITTSLPEGFEEISQSAASNIAGTYYGSDVHNFYKSRWDPEASDQNLDFIRAFAKGLNDTINDGSAWEEFFIGALTGALGMPVFGKANTSGNSVYLGKGKQIGLAGGILGEMKSSKQNNLRDKEIADYMNARIQSPEFANYYQGLNRHQKLQNDMNRAVVNNDEKAYKDAEYGQLVSDIIMFDNAGKLSDLLTLINSAYDTSQENLESIIRNTSTVREIDGKKTVVGPFAEFATINADNEVVANFADDTQVKKMADKITSTRDEILKTVDDYITEKNSIDVLSGNRLSDDQLKELTWMKMQSKNWVERAGQMGEEILPFIERLVQQYESDLEILNSQLEDERTKSSEAGSPTEEFKKIQKSIKAREEDLKILKKWSKAKGKDLAIELASNDLFIDKIKEYSEDEKDKKANSYIEAIKALLRASPRISADEYVKASRALDDIRKIQKSKALYDKKYKQFLEHPEQQAEELNNADKEVKANHSKKEKSALARRFNFNGTIAELADTLAKNEKDIKAVGGFKEFLKMFSQEEQVLLNQAKKFRRGVGSVSSAISSSSLSESAKRAAAKLVDEVAPTVGTIQELEEKILERLNGNATAELIQKDSRESDLAYQTKISTIEAALKTFFEKKLKEISKKLDEQERLSEGPKKAPKESAAEPTKAPQEPETKAPQEPIEGAELPSTFIAPSEKEYSEPADPHLSDAEKQIRVLKEKDEERKRDPNAPSPSPNRKLSDVAYAARPQLSEYYLHGRDGETYLDYITKHPEAIPNGVDKNAFVQYIRETVQYLKDKGAFDYVSGKNKDRRLKPRQEIYFKVDEELNERAGTKVVLIATLDEQGNEQIIGSLPSELDFQTTKTINDKEVSLAEERPAQKALFDEVYKLHQGDSKASNQPISREEIEKEITKIITANGSRGFVQHFYEHPEENLVGQFAGTSIEDYDKAVELIPRIISKLVSEGKSFKEIADRLGGIRDWQLLGANPGANQSILLYLKGLLSKDTTTSSDITTKVSTLLGGRIMYGEQEHSVSDIFGSDVAPVIAYLGEDAALHTKTDGSQESTLVSPGLSNVEAQTTPFQIYVMIPANNGKYLPALTYATKLSDIIDNQDDWYVQNLISAFTNFNGNLSDIKSYVQNIFKWLHVPGLSVSFGRYSGRSWVYEKNDLGNATHLRITYTNPRDVEGNPFTQFVKLTDGKISSDDVLEAIKKILDVYEDTSCNVDIHRLGNSKSNQEYRKNIAKYLHTNVDPRFNHTVNDFFIYDPTDIEKQVSKQHRTAPSPKEAKKTSKKDDIGQTITTYGGKEYVIRGDEVLDSNNNNVSDALRKEILESLTSSETLPKPPTQKKTSISLFAHNSSESSGGELTAEQRARLNRAMGKKLAVGDTTEGPATREALYQNDERIRKLLPQLSEQGRIIVVQGLIKTIDEAGNPIEAYGEFRDGILTISSQAPLGTVYHEAFHYVTDMLLSDSDRDTLFEVAKQKYGDMDDLSLEEKMAEDFRHFMNARDDKSILGRLRTFFSNLKHIVKGLTGNLSKLDILFYDIYKGRYANRQESFTSESDRFYNSERIKYQERKTRFNSQTSETQEYLKMRGITEQDYDALPIEDREIILRCVI